jgi:ADP-ribose pyrophosphatase YjhB (NUDIX family)
MQAAGILPYCPKTGRYLIAKRGPNISNPNQWTNFGGKANKGENPAQTAVREFKEESGYKGSVRLNRPIPTKNNKDGITFYNFIGEVPAEFQPTTIGKKTVDGDVEVSASKWVTKEQLTGLIGNSILHPGFNRFLNLKFNVNEDNMKNINYVKKLIRKTVLNESTDMELTDEEIKRIGLSAQAIDDFRKFVIGKNFKTKFDAMTAYITHRAKLIGWDRN